MTSERFGWLRRLLGNHWKDLALVGLIILAMVLCFADVLFQPYTFYYQDIQFLHYPGKIYFMESLKEGDYGFWSPYIFCGYPLQAEPEVGPLYPLNAFFALPIPPFYAQTLFVVLHYILAGIFTYLLARSFNQGRGGALVAALTYSCSGYLMAQLTNFSILTAVIWLPLILLLFSQALRQRSYRYAAATGVVIALFMLTAHPQIILLTLTVVGLYYLYDLACLLRAGSQARGRLALKSSLLLLVAVAVGAALAAPQLLPAYQLKSLSVLSESLGFDFVTSYSLSPYRMASFLVPNFLGNQATGYRGPAFYEEHHNYIGLLSLVLVALAWAKRRDRGALFFWLLLPLSLVLSWGRSVPILYQLISQMPLYNLFRVPARWLYPMTMALAMLAGFGFDHLLASPRSDRLQRMAKALLAVAGILTLTLPWLFVLKPQVMSLTGWFVEHVYPSFAVYTLRSVVKGLVQFPNLPPSNLLLHAFPFLINPLIFFLAMLDLSVLLLYLYLSGRWPARWFRIAAIVVITFDLLLVSGSAINPVAQASYFDKRDSTAFLQQNTGLYRIYPTNQDGDPNLMLGHYFPSIYKVPSFGGSSSLTVRWFKEYKDAAAKNPRLYDLAGIKYVLQEGAKPPPSFSAPLREVFTASGLHIFENPNVMPRAFIIHDALALAQDTALSQLADPAFPFERTVLLDDSSAVALLGSRGGPRATDTADIRHYSYNDVTVECQTEAPGFLVLSDSYYPGWEAKVDGQPQPIYRADHIFRAVFLTPGHHTVTFHFARPAFGWGLKIAIATVVLLVGLWVMSLLKRRNGNPAERSPADLG